MTSLAMTSCSNSTRFGSLAASIQCSKNGKKYLKFGFGWQTWVWLSSKSSFKKLKIHYYIWVWTNIFTPKDPFITLFCTFKINVLVAKAAPSLEDSIINNNTVQHRQDNLEADGGSTSILKDDDNSGTILVWLSTQVLLKKTPPMMMQRPPRWCWLEERSVMLIIHWKSMFRPWSSPFKAHVRPERN